MEVAMAGEERPGGTGRQGPEERRLAAARDDDLERRRRDLEASLASRLPDGPEGEDGRGKGGRSSGYAQAFKLSSEFIAGIAVRAEERRVGKECGSRWEEDQEQTIKRQRRQGASRSSDWG